MERGRSDPTTVVTVSVMVYYTRQFASLEKNPEGFVAEAFRDANSALENSKIPIELQLHCTEELDVDEEGDSSTILGNFEESKGRLFSVH